jgi:hypothetical protein
MDRSLSADRFSAGDEVFSADGEKVGIVAAVHPGYLLVEQGMLFVSEYHIPLSAIDRYEDDSGRVTLNVTRDEALASGWETHPDYREPSLAPSDTVLTGAASTPDTGNVIAEVDQDDDPLAPDEYETS